MHIWAKNLFQDLFGHLNPPKYGTFTRNALREEETNSDWLSLLKETNGLVRWFRHRKSSGP